MHARYNQAKLLISLDVEHSVRRTHGELGKKRLWVGSGTPAASAGFWLQVLGYGLGVAPLAASIEPQQKLAYSCSRPILGGTWT